jgi:hypothetical protein
MLTREIRRMMKENEKYARMLEDRTGKLPIEKIRRSFTIKRMTTDKLKTVPKRTGESMSGIIDDLVEEKL